MSHPPDNSIKSELIEHEKKRKEVPFVVVGRNVVSDCLELTINFSPRDKEFNHLKFQFTNPQDINQSRKEILELVNWVMNDVFQVDIEKAETLYNQIINQGFQSLWHSDKGVGDMKQTISNIFRKIDNSEGITTQHIMCHDFNSFSIGVLEILLKINPMLSDIDPILPADIATIYTIYKQAAGISYNPRLPKKLISQIPHEHFVVPTLQLMLWINDVILHIDKYIPVTIEA